MAGLEPAAQQALTVKGIGEAYKTAFETVGSSLVEISTQPVFPALRALC